MMKLNRVFRVCTIVFAAFCLSVLAGHVGPAGAATFPALEAPAESAGSGHNMEGVKHYDKGHWDKAEMHFREAVNSDGNLAEAHYNLALALDKLNRHKEASQEFKKALDLAPDDPDIAESAILKKHLGM